MSQTLLDEQTQETSFGNEQLESMQAEFDDAKRKLDAVGEAFAVIEFEPDGTIVDANDSFLRTVGYRLSEIQGKHHRMFVAEEEARSPEYGEFWKDLVRGIPHQGEFRRVNADGDEVWLNARYSPLKDESGTVYRVIKYAFDVTEAVKARRFQALMTAIVANAPINIMFANRDGKITYINPASERTLKTIEHQLPIPVSEIVGSSYDIFHQNPSRQRTLLADPKNLPHSANIKVGDDTLALTASPIFDADGNYAGPMVAWEVITEKLELERRTKEAQEREREQQLELQRKVDELLEVVNAAAEGDLTRRVTVSGDDAVGQLAAGLQKMVEDLRGVITQVVEGAAQFTEGSRVVSESAQSFANGAQTQSAAVEEMSASVDQLSKSINHVRESAEEASDVAAKTRSLAEQGGVAVKKSIEAMDRIKASSSQISEIIQVISEIASQTNLLALNAAIEAARAGEHGLGFAVVADEVRKLAERSSEAAKEISTLIQESTVRVDEGASLSEETGGALTKIIEGVEATATRIAQIAESMVEQSQNANEVSTAINQIAEITEQAAAGSEEMAASSEELGAQAVALRDVVSGFKTE